MEKEIESLEKLLNYLEDKAKRHQAIHHYTDMESLIKIITSHSFLASTGFNMNDQLELTSGMKSKWQQLYFTSFSYGNESIAMWGLYCFPRESAIRLSIDNKAMLKWLNTLNHENNIQYGLLGEQPKHLKSNSIKSITLTDIIYSDEKGGYLRRGNYDRLQLSKKSTNLFRDSRMTGRIKDNAWLAENEVRLLIETKNILSSDVNVKLFAKFNDDFIKTLKVLIGPWCDDQTFTIYHHKLVELGLKSEHIIRSKFTGLLKMKTPCDKCSYKQNAIEYEKITSH